MGPIIEACMEIRLLQLGLNLSFSCFSLHLGANGAITWPSFFLQPYACCHLVPHVILHLIMYFLLCNK